MSDNLISLTLLFCTFSLGAACICMFLTRVKQKKKILDSIKKAKTTFKEYLENNEIRLQKISGNYLTDDLKMKISEIISVEKENCHNLMALFLDYHPAAIEMLPSIANNIITAYIDCIQYIILQSKIPPSVEDEALSHDKNITEAEIESEDDLDERFQYEALIEQLRYEKQDFADKYKYSQQLLNAIYIKYKEQLDIDKQHESIRTMKLDEVAQLFQVEYKS